MEVRSKREPNCYHDSAAGHDPPPATRNDETLPEAWCLNFGVIYARSLRVVLLHSLIFCRGGVTRLEIGNWCRKDGTEIKIARNIPSKIKYKIYTYTPSDAGLTANCNAMEVQNILVMEECYYMYSCIHCIMYRNKTPTRTYVMEERM